jgi:hypothetical protein
LIKKSLLVRVIGEQALALAAYERRPVLTSLE